MQFLRNLFIEFITANVTYSVETVGRVNHDGFIIIEDNYSFFFAERYTIKSKEYGKCEKKYFNSRDSKAIVEVGLKFIDKLFLKSMQSLFGEGTTAVDFFRLYPVTGKRNV
jgi:hypothetical protein